RNGVRRVVGGHRAHLPRASDAARGREGSRARGGETRDSFLAMLSFRGGAKSAFTRVFDALWRRARNPDAHSKLFSGFRARLLRSRPGMTAQCVDAARQFLFPQ